MAALLALHALTTIMMTGLIWFVQLVHYPLFQHVGLPDFVRYEQEHMRRVTWIVAPLMSLEALSAIAICMLAEDSSMRAWALAGLVLLAAIWASTALLQVRCHKALACGFVPLTARRLVSTNWIRTVAWSLRSGIALFLPWLMVRACLP